METDLNRSVGSDWVRFISWTFCSSFIQVDAENSLTPADTALEAAVQIYR